MSAKRFHIGETYGWLGQMEELHGATVSLVPLASYDAPNPIEEMCDMVGAEKVYVASAGRPSGSDGNTEAPA